MRTLSNLLLAFGFLAVVAHAQDGENDYDEEGGDYEDQDVEEEALSAEQLHQLHSKLDQNGDGKVSLSEVMAFSSTIGRAIAGKDISSILSEVDTSKDGKLSLEEHLNDIHSQADGGDEEELKDLEQRKKVEAAKFRAADLDHDGLLDEKEIAALFYPETNDAVLAITVAETMRQKDANGDGKLSPREFWEADAAEGEEGELSEEELADFAKLDRNGDGFLDLEELRPWESGKFHTEQAMKQLIEVADKDGDLHVTAAELADARQEIATMDAQYHFLEWAEHGEL